MAHQLDPERGWARDSRPFQYLARAHHDVGEFEEELADVAFALRHDSTAVAPQALDMLVPPLAALGRDHDLNAVLDSVAARRTDGSLGILLSTAAAEARSHGHPGLSRRLTARCVRWFTAADTSAALQRYGLILAHARCLTEAGRLAEARSVLSRNCMPSTDWLKLDDCEFLDYGSLSAQLGDTAEVSRMRRVAAEIAAHRHIMSAYPLLLESRIEAVGGDRDSAVAHLRRAVAFMGLPLLIHTDIGYASLRGYAPFEQLIARP
jgi:hypothetical protein